MITEITQKIKDNIEGRYALKENDELLSRIKNLMAESSFSKQVLRFSRKNEKSESNFCKTILVVHTDRKCLKEVFEWTALTKEILLDPESADLYLFILWVGDDIPSEEECFRIESSEEFCRKYVLGPGEEIASLLARSFIHQFDIPDKIDLGQDPLLRVFAGMNEQFPWFDETEKEKWLAAFNSGDSSYDLFYALIKSQSTGDATS